MLNAIKNNTIDENRLLTMLFPGQDLRSAGAHGTLEIFAASSCQIQVKIQKSLTI